MQSALQHHAVGRIDFVLGRADRLPVNGEAFLTGKPPRLALTADESRVEEELRDGPRSGRDLDRLRSSCHECTGIASIVARRRVGMTRAISPLCLIPKR